MLAHPAVAMVAVIPADDAGLVKPKAIVVVRPDARDRVGAALADELKAHVQARLSKHKYPRWVVFVDDLPKNDRGKVDKKLLVERERRGQAGVTDSSIDFLAHHTTASLARLIAERTVVALVPIGSTEPHGPHLGLGTDVVISEAARARRRS